MREKKPKNPYLRFICASFFVVYFALHVINIPLTISQVKDNLL